MYNQYQQPPMNPMQNIQQQMSQLQQEYQNRLGELKQQAQSMQMNMQQPYQQQSPQQQFQNPNMPQQQAAPQPQSSQSHNSVQMLAVLGDIKGNLDKMIEMNTQLLEKLGVNAQVSTENEEKEVKPNKTEKK